jgi:hypothetical protein
MATAIEDAGAAFAALGDAERRAEEAMWANRGRFDPPYRNLYELWLVYCWMSRHQRSAVATYRRQVRRAIKVYRHLNVAETRGTDTSSHGWRGGRAA